MCRIVFVIDFAFIEPLMIGFAFLEPLMTVTLSSNFNFAHGLRVEKINHFIICFPLIYGGDDKIFFIILLTQ